VPCGILDQAVSGFGQKNHLVFIDCRGPRFETVPLPQGAHFWIFNTHTKHALVDGLYAARHRECMDAARALGVGLLVDITPAKLAASSAALTGDAAKRARHVVEEIARVDRAVQALRAGDLTGVGQLLTASHRSSQSLFENSTPELDFLVDTLVKAPHVYGARLTGGGFGGAVMAMTSGEFGRKEAEAVAAAYAHKFGAAPDILHALTGNGAERVS
jgi:galactokinase